MNDNLADWLVSQTNVVGECWMWTGARNDHSDYGRITLRQEKVYVHRLSYELFVGPIPEGLTIDHICRNTGCLNPAHLRAVTQRDNTVKYGKTGACAVNSRRTYCKNGHPFDSNNTRVRHNGHRQCKTCNRHHDRERYRRRKNAGLLGPSSAPRV